MKRMEESEESGWERGGTKKMWKKRRDRMEDEMEGRKQKENEVERGGDGQEGKGE